MILEELGDEVRGARIVCVFRKQGRDYLIPLVPGQKRLTVIRGAPARAIVEKALRYRERTPRSGDGTRAEDDAAQ